MVNVPWTGPYYPPDAAEQGKTPSPDSDVFVALKRTLGRLGAWPWDPPSYDRSFSNGFAHGSSNGPGIAGIQKWAKIQPTGFIGLSTWNFLRSVRVQEGRPHAGEPAIDDYSANLIRDAAKTPPAPTKQPRQVALDHMSGRVGYTENPANSNSDSRPDGIRTSQDRCANGTWLRGEPWCGCWCYYALESADVAKIDSHLASVAQIEDYARQGQKCYRGWTNDRGKVKVGDLVVIGGRGVHVEMVRAAPTSSSTLTYGGNTSPGTSGSQSNGGGAYARTRYPSEVYGYALIRYPGD
jgi:hypothetical protein